MATHYGQIRTENTDINGIVMAVSAHRSGNDPIPGFGFNPQTAAVSGFEITDLAALRRRMSDGSLERVHRADFHTLTLVTEGSGEHTVDFVTYPCSPGTLLWIRPGQMQRFGPPGGMNGTHTLFTPAFPPAFSSTDRLARRCDRPPARILRTHQLRQVLHPPHRYRPRRLPPHPPAVISRANGKRPDPHSGI